MRSMPWSRIAAIGKAFHTRKRLRACSAVVEPSLTPASCKHLFPLPSRKPPTSSPPQERVCRQRCRRWSILHSASSITAPLRCVERFFYFAPGLTSFLGCLLLGYYTVYYFMF